MLKIFLADYAAIWQMAFKLCFTEGAGFTVVGKAEHGANLLDLIIEAAPDIAVIDLKMPGCNVLTVARELKVRAPHICVVLVSNVLDIVLLSQAVTEGISAYVLKRDDDALLLEAVWQAHNGEVWIDPAFRRSTGFDASTGRMRQAAITLVD